MQVIPIPISVITTTNALCSTSCNGILNGVSSGGNSPFTYSITNTTCTTLPCASLCPGLYTVYTFNNQGCQSSNVFSISSPAALQASLSVSNASCVSCPNGIISTNAYGGSSPYSYTWSPSGGNSSIASNLLPGCYTVTIADKNGCSRTNGACVEVTTVTTGIQNQFSDDKLLI